MKIFDLFRRRKIDPDITVKRKISTIEQELLDRCKNGNRINPKNDYSHAIGTYTIVDGYSCHAVGVANKLSYDGYMDRHNPSGNGRCIGRFKVETGGVEGE